MSIPQINLARKQVGRIGYGLMQLSRQADIPQDEAFEVMKAAVEGGATAWSTSATYGPPTNPLANVQLIGAFFRKYPEYKDSVVIVLKGLGDKAKFGAVLPLEDMVEKGREELRACQEALGDKTIDVYSPARVTPGVPIEQVMEKLRVLRDEGLFTEVGLSEVKGETLERANKILPIACLEIEVSLWSYDDDIRTALASAQNLGVPVFAYSPLGRGFLVRKWKSPEDIPRPSLMSMTARFQGEAFYHNLKLVDVVDEIAASRGIRPSDVALAWVLGLNDVTIPIPGTVNPERVRSNTAAAAIQLSDEERKRIDNFLAMFQPSGGRYPAMFQDHLMQ